MLSDYHARRLPPSGVLAVSDHLADCAACREALTRLRPASDAAPTPDDLPVVADPAGDAPSYEEMAALLDGTLPPEQAAKVRARLEASPRAAAEFADLQAFRDESAVRPPVVHRPAESSASSGAGTRSAPGKIVAFPGWTRVVLAVAAMLVLMAAGAWRFAHRSSERDAGPLLAGVDLGALPADLRHSVEKAARTGRIDRPTVPPELRPSAETLAGEADAPGTLEQIGPVGTMVRRDRPALRWKGRPDATGYVVYLGADGAGAPPFRQELPAGRTDWTPPAPLTRGLAYEWQVEARRGAEVIDRAPRPPAPEARFEVLGEADVARLQQIERSARGNPLVLGAAYGRAGLREEAAEQFRELARQHPDSSVAGRLQRASEEDSPPR